MLVRRHRTLDGMAKTTRLMVGAPVLSFSFDAGSGSASNGPHKGEAHLATERRQHLSDATSARVAGGSSRPPAFVAGDPLRDQPLALLEALCMALSTEDRQEVTA
jgi:hypothetical protein